uniref:non-specific serine/threonine protein kinase n=1 Tax=Kalanchoe fedtschenkoi TaxID=63787 RepID=A0A7N0VBB0_KALFE
MNLSSRQSLTSWRSVLDPAPGLYSLRLKPPEYGEIELVFNRTVPYWSTGNWTGDRFVGVLEMTIPYIYRFHFLDAFSADANSATLRFYLDYDGQLKQFTWSPQLGNWNMFWSQPESMCRVNGLCGQFGICNGRTMKPCCLTGFNPSNVGSWGNGDYSGGCRRSDDEDCSPNDEFAEVGFLVFEGAYSVALLGSRSFCEESCLTNCSCIEFSYLVRNNACKNIFGSLLNARNVTSGSTMDVDTVIGLSIVLAISFMILLVIGWRRHKREKNEGDHIFPVTNLRVFSYKELNAATKSFSEKLGHGGFGAVFKGELLDSSIVAVKHLERPGGGEKEFRAEVCTIGNIQHLNLVRLQGFCSENSHRLLVYDYMENGPLSSYIRRDGPNLSWDVRFRVALGTARAPENILLDSDYSAKVSDFGLAKLIGRDFSRIIATMRGTWGYVALEWISGVAITTKADVYSYGMTLLELISGRRNVERLGKGQVVLPPYAAQLIIEGNTAAVMDDRLNGSYNALEAERVGLVAIWCIQDDEESRPRMGSVVKMLEGIVAVTTPPQPKLIQALVSGESFPGVKPDSSNQTLASMDSTENFEVLVGGGSHMSLDARP